MVSLTLGDSGEQLMPLRAGGWIACVTATVVESEVLPPSFETVSEMVRSPTESNEVTNSALEPVAGSPPPLQA